ncbi:hypothetical protein FSB08_16185 [Paraburkholderia sp. JPY432]|nr:hypothetical protein [Paraburkholderia youngii]
MFSKTPCSTRDCFCFRGISSTWRRCSRLSPSRGGETDWRFERTTIASQVRGHPALVIPPFPEASGVPRVFDSENDAVSAGLAWAPAWDDSHG